MSGPSIRVLTCKGVQIEGEKQRMQRVISGLERQLTQHKGILRGERKRFAEVKAAAVAKSGRGLPDGLRRAGFENLVQKAQEIKTRQRRTVMSAEVIKKRKQLQGADFAKLACRAEIVQRELAHLRSRKERCEDVADCEYWALLGAHGEDRKRIDMNQLLASTHGSEGLGGCFGQTEQRVQASTRMAEQGSCEVPAHQQAILLKTEKRDCLDLEYRALDGSRFNLEMDRQGKDLQILILPEHESDRRLLRKDKDRLREELRQRGFRVTAFGIYDPLSSFEGHGAK